MPVPGFPTIEVPDGDRNALGAGLLPTFRELRRMAMMEVRRHHWSFSLLFPPFSQWRVRAPCAQCRLMRSHFTCFPLFSIGSRRREWKPDATSGVQSGGGPRDECSGLWWHRLYGLLHGVLFGSVADDATAIPDAGA